MGERLLRELQLQTQRRDACEGNLLHDEGSKNADRMVARALQHVTSALVARLQTACAESHLAKALHAALRSGRGGMNAVRQPAESNKSLGTLRWVRPMKSKKSAILLAALKYKTYFSCASWRCNYCFRKHATRWSYIFRDQLHWRPTSGVA